MRFTFTCLVLHHANGRFTVTPLEHPDLSLHAVSLEGALEELTLALGDQIHRAHPKKLPSFLRSGAGTLRTLELGDVLPVWTARGCEHRPLRLSSIWSPSLGKRVEVHVPRLGIRYWLEKDSEEQAVQLLREHLRQWDEVDLLALRMEGQESLVELVVEARPSRLSDFKPRELDLDERPPPRPPEEGEDDDEDEDSDAAPEDPGKRGKGVRTPTLDRIGVAWHRLARDGALEGAYERDDLVSRLLAHVRAKAPEPLVLIGPAGVGKTAILHELARRLASKNAPDDDRRHRFFLVDAPRLIAGEGFFGDWQRQTLEAFEEARKANALLSLGRVVELLDAGKSAHSDHNVAQLILPLLLARSALIFAEATPTEWSQVEQRHQAFSRAFSVLRVEEPSPEATLRVLTRVSREARPPPQAPLPPEAIEEVLALCGRFQPYGSTLGNSVAFLRRVLALHDDGTGKPPGRWDITARFSSETGIPLVMLRDNLPLEAADVRRFLSARVIGQRAAVDRVADVVCLIKAGLTDRRRPMSVLFFAGPTGVGKTELTKALAELMFGSRERLIRLDMGEYVGPDAVARLLGESGSAGSLCAAVRRQPFSVVLLDEIEKAHPSLFDALLGVLGEGRLTDATGAFTDFRNTVIILTSNLGADTVRSRVGFSGGDPSQEASALQEHYRQAARSFFRPEFFNRLDEVIVFEPLRREQIDSILARELDRVAARAGLTQRDVSLEVPPPVREWLAAQGVDPRYGARPLKRVIERELVAALSAHLAAAVQTGSLHVHAELQDGQRLRFRSETIPRESDDGSRKQIRATLEEASRLRSELRAWMRSPPMTAMQDELRTFDKLSRQPAFWHDQALAQESARKAAETRELDQAFRGALRQAEAADELAFEAYFDRSAPFARGLSTELPDTAREFELLKERLFFTLFPAGSGSTLLLLASQGAAQGLAFLLSGYVQWAHGRGLKAQALAANRVALRSSKQRANEHGWTWKPWKDGEAAPEAAACLVSSSVPGLAGRAHLLLSAEHGLHRFMARTVSGTVKVRFQPALLAPSLLPEKPLEMEEMPGREIRRLWLQDDQDVLVKDLRTGTEHSGSPGAFSPAPFLPQYVTHSIFRTHEDDR